MGYFVVYFIVIVLTIIFFVLPPYIGYKFAIKKSRKESMSKIDFLKEKEYYREVLKEYSPAELKYIDDFQVDAKREIVATLLSLKLKRKIDIEPNKITVIDLNLDNLKKTEIFVLENIRDGKVKIENEEDLQLKTEEEAFEDGLIFKRAEEKSTKPKKPIKTSWLILGTIWATVLVSLGMSWEEGAEIAPENISASQIIYIAMFLITIFVSGAAPIYTAISSIAKHTSYKRTEKGEEINKKLEGLKKYITDYSLLNEKEDLETWEEYLIYSIIFNLNDTAIVEEISKLIKIKYELGKIYVVEEGKEEKE